MNNSNIPTSVLKKEIEDLMLSGGETKLAELADLKGINTESLKRAMKRNAVWLRNPEWVIHIKKIWRLPKHEVITEVIHD